MSSLNDLDKVGMTGARTFVYAVTMPLAVAVFLYGAFNVVVTLMISRAPSTKEWLALAIGIVAIPLALMAKRGAGTFKKVLATDAARVATLKLLSQRATGVGLGRSVGYAQLVDAEDRLIAQLVVNDVAKFPLVREAVLSVAPKVNVIEEAVTVRPGMAIP